MTAGPAVTDRRAGDEADLAAAVARVRSRLAALLPPSPAAVPPAVDPPEPRRRGLFERWTRGDDAPEPLILLPPPSDSNAPPVAAAATDAPPSALALLAERFGLTPFEHDVLMLCIAYELDTGIAATCAAVHGDGTRDYPTLALALAMADAPEWAALSPRGPLRHWRLIEVDQPPGRALTASAIRADERIVNYVKGLNELDVRLADVVEPLPGPDAVLPASHAVVAAAIDARAGDAPIALRGRDRDSKRAIAAAVAAAHGVDLFRLAADAIPAAPADAELLARLWARETRLLPVALYLDAHDAPPAVGQLMRFAARAGGLVFVDATDGEAPAVDVARPTAAEQAAAWAARLGDDAGPLPARLAGEFDLSATAIAAVVATARGAPDDAPLGDRLWDAARARARPTMARLAERIDARAGFADIVLPPAETDQLRAIVAQVGARTQVYDDWDFRARMNRGLGISVLFAGDSGTGKTMAAEVLATALRLDLYRIDLSAVVSKYIGETEKNLRQVFDAADAGGTILFFDEADALFGKRSEVKDAHDRYANIEVDYLLQRMEGFGGLAILATNMKSALDPAFMRRLRFIVNFPHPGVAERRAMWARVFPAKTPVDVLDLDRLARLNLSGGNIHSIALNAAFSAADAGVAVSTALVLDAARAELRKLDRPVNEADFRAVAAVRA